MDGCEKQASLCCQLSIFTEWQIIRRKNVASSINQEATHTGSLTSCTKTNSSNTQICFWQKAQAAMLFNKHVQWHTYNACTHPHTQHTHPGSWKHVWFAMEITVKKYWKFLCQALLQTAIIKIWSAITSASSELFWNSLEGFNLIQMQQCFFYNGSFVFFQLRDRQQNLIPTSGFTCPNEGT